MKKLIFYFLVLVAAVWLGLIMHANPGYVMLHVGNISLEATLWTSVLALIVLFLLIFFLIRILQGLYYIPERYRRWSGRREEKKLHHLTQQGFIALLEERLDKAKKFFLGAAQQGDQSFLDYVCLAHIAQRQNNYSLRDKYLQQARERIGSAHALPVNIVQARWQLESKQWQPALDTLSHIRADHPNHSFVLRGLKEIYYEQNDWKNLEKLLPQLKRHHVLDPAALYQLDVKTSLALLREAGDSHQPELLEKAWKALPKTLRQDPTLLSAYVGYLIQENQHDKAEDLLKVKLKKSLDSPLLDEYARVVSSNPAKQLSRAEVWLEQNPDNADVLLCLGRLCIRYNLWGKARSYLEGCLEKGFHPEVYHLLSQVLKQLGEPT